MNEDKNNTFDDFSNITSEGSLNAFQTSRIYHTEHHLPNTHHFINDYKEEAQVPEVKLSKQSKKFNFKFLLGLVLTMSLLGLFIGVGAELTRTYIFKVTPEVQVKYIPTLTQNSNPLTTQSLSVVDIANTLEPSVVAITNEKIQQTFFGQTTAKSSGSGVIFDISTEYLYILTNNHVIEDSNVLYVSFYGEKILESTVIGADPETDLAVITVDRSLISDEHLAMLKPVLLGDSDALNVGEMAIAIGNPLGYNNTVTVGVISALNRIISNDLNALSLIQTDAAINPGNSGGALVNSKGEIIGINTIKIADTSVEGIGFAIPINSAIPILKELIEQGFVSRPYIGIYGQEVDQATASTYDLPLGVVINDFVDNGPAINSDLKLYDIIIAVEGKAILTMRDLTQEISQHEIGDQIELTVMREVNKKFVEKKVMITVDDRYEK